MSVEFDHSEEGRSKIRVAVTAGAVAAVAVVGAFVSRGASASEVNACRDVPPVPDSGLSFQGQLPPGCTSVDQWLNELRFKENSGQVKEGTGQTNEIQIP